MKTNITESVARQRYLHEKFPVRKSVLAMSGALLATVASLNLHAQDAIAEEPEEKSEKSIALEEIVVTGTHIRGIEPVGQHALDIDAESIVISGAQTANEVLGTLPQAQNLFNDRPTLNPRAVSRITVVRPNLRGLPGFEQASGAATLVLVDGHRVVGMGVAQSAPDPDIVPPGVIERVEVLTDGGSSLYGADAVGGVVNIITRDSFDGVEIDAGYNTGDDYWSYDTNITAGTSWESGSGYISLAYADRDSLLGQDRDWAAQGVWTDEGLQPDGTECISPVGTTQNMQYRELIPGIRVWDGRAFPVQAVGERCDTSQLATLFPKEERQHLFFGISQDLNDDVALDVKGYYSERETIFESYPRGDSISFGPSQFSPTPVAEVGEIRERGSVGFSYFPHPDYVHHEGETTLESYGITPELTIDMENGWQLRNMLHYSRSDNQFIEPATNATALNEAVAAGLLDPTNIAAAPTDVIAGILDQEFSGEAVQELFLARFVTDGSLMELPSGDMRLAAGFEFQEHRSELRQGTGVIGHLGGVDFREASRDVKSFFAELNVPLLSGVRGAESLTLAASVRYDEYSDFGSTTNPTIGLEWQPVDWISIRGNWGESFVAPTLIDELNAQAVFASAANAVGIVQPSADRAGVTIEEGRTDVAFLNGAQPNLAPQTADTWSVGFEMSPPVAEGLTVGANYYEIEFFELLGGINPQLATAAVLFPERYVWNPTLADLQAAAAEAVNGEEILAGIDDPATVAAILDLRVGNTDEATLKGIDFRISYQHDTDIGTLGYTLSGTHRTEFDLTQGGVTGDELEFGTPETLAVASVGIQKDNWQANLNWKYTAGFDVDDARQGQTSVDDFQVIDLFYEYRFQGPGLMDELSLRFRVDNIFDEEPEIYRLNNQPSYRSFSLGRVYGLGVTKRFR